MNKNHKLFLIILISFLNTSLSWDQYNFDILNDRDFALQENQDRPTLQSPIGEEPYRESYNEWQCFPTHSVQIHYYNREGKSPEDFNPDEREEYDYYAAITLWHENRLFVFESPNRESLSECLEQTTAWINLMNNQETVCLFSAKWPETEEERSHFDYDYWLIYGMKTLLGRVMVPIYEDEKKSDSEEVEEEDIENNQNLAVDEEQIAEEQSIDLEEKNYFSNSEMIEEQMNMVEENEGQKALETPDDRLSE